MTTTILVICLIAMMGLLYFLLRFSIRSENEKSLHLLKASLVELSHEQARLLQQSLNQSVHETKLVLDQSVVNLGNMLQQNLHITREALENKFDLLMQTNDTKLQSISNRVEQRLQEGFEKTTATFMDIVKRLAIIDDAQKKMADLSKDVISLQEILTDKRSRGAFGEVQLNALIRNMLPEESYTLQYTFTTGARVDCLLKLPEPTGFISIDSKFPLENYRLMNDSSLGDADRTQAKARFRQDIRKHIQDIKTKYIIPGETSDGAILFLPAEAVFLDIFTNFADCVEFAYQARVWIASPTTMMAILTTARAVLKDAATREQVHIIQQHLKYLSDDFSRFEKRMNNLAKHIEQAHTDVGDIQTSASKITSRFNKIEKVELDSEPSALSLPED